MAVRIRMTRIGKKNSPFFRIGAYDAHKPRNGESIEYLGWYNPLMEKPEQQLKVNVERVQYWLSVGAQPSDKTAILLKKAGVVFPHAKKKAKKPKDKKVNTPAKANNSNKKQKQAK